MHKLYITTMPGVWRWQLCKILVTYTPENAKRAQRKFIWWTRKYEHFGRIRENRRCFQWRHSREEPYTSRRRIIAQAQIFSAFTSPEVEVNIIQRWLIVTSLQRGGSLTPDISMSCLEKFPVRINFLSWMLKAVTFFTFEKPAGQWWLKGEIENGCSSSSFYWERLANAVTMSASLFGGLFNNETWEGWYFTFLFDK